MKRSLLTFALRLALTAVLASLFAAASVEAQIYTVIIKGGASFDTRYEPVEADWDPSVKMILTDQGNWIALDNQDIIDIVSGVEAQGFGYRLDTSTIVLGSYHEGLADEADPSNPAAQAGDFDARAAGYIPVEGEIGRPSESDSFTVEQFVDTGDAGAGGIPLEYTVYQ